MGGFRRLVIAHRGLAAFVLALALMVKLLVPAGYMPMLADGAVMLAPCSGHGVEMPAMVSSAMPVHPSRSDGATREQMPCGFAGHAPAAMAGADPVPLVIALSIFVASAIRIPPRPTIPRASLLRPHSRGPPPVIRLHPFPG